MGWFQEYETPAGQEYLKKRIDEEARSYGEWLFQHMYGDYADDIAREKKEEKEYGSSRI
ncbi:MAG: hypothetical protein HPY71_14395 [Firmicutes bacterium]|nr:hypothetical protein [Bacillota bacterium]